MPTYLTPGVYIEEAPSKQTPIEGVGTSVAAFIGLAAGGPRNEPLRISSWSQFERLFSHPADPEGASERFEGVRLSAIATELNRKSSFVKLTGAKAQLGPLAPGTYRLEPPP